MGEVKLTKSKASALFRPIIGLFVIEPAPFSTKRRLNLRAMKWLLGTFLLIFLVAVFASPDSREETGEFHSKQPEQQTQEDTQSRSTKGVGPTTPTSGYTSLKTAHPGGEEQRGADRNSSMIIARGNDLSTTLPEGTKFWVALSQNVTITNRALPVIGKITSPAVSRSSIAIPEDSQIFGEAVLDRESERASIVWKSILFPDGRSKAISALALGEDNQVGVEGNFHSDALKNTAGQLLSRFAGGLAEGAITRTPFGASQGGIGNGLLQGAADTAKDRTDAWSDDLKKPKTWLELQSGAHFQVILTQPFIFRDPGGIN